MDVDAPDILNWLTAALAYGASALEDIVHGLEGAPRSLDLDPSAWQNTMSALEWALKLGLTCDRVSGIAATEEDLQRLRRVHALGAEVLSGREASPDLLPLARRCLLLLEGGDHPPA